MEQSDQGTATLESVARQRVFDDILCGELPPNSKLKVRELSARYGIGASPLREALSRLVPEGLVTVESNKGFRVASLSIRELIEITEMREILETEAFRRAIERGDDRWESEIISSFHVLSKAIDRYVPDINNNRIEWERRHHAFHRTLLAACGNRKLMRSVDILHQHLVRYRMIFMMTELSPERLRFIHEELKQVALDRDVEAAIPIMRRHVTVNLDLVRAGIAAHASLREMISDA